MVLSLIMSREGTLAFQCGGFGEWRGMLGSESNETVDTAVGHIFTLIAVSQILAHSLKRYEQTTI